jgi:hypothetical protein
MENLNDNQIKSLITGVKLAAEIKASDIDLSCFISIFAYQYDEQGQYIEMTKFLKTIKEEDEDVFFLLRKYEIPNEFIKNGWFATDDDLINYIYLEDIKGFKNIENELLKYISNLSILEPEWKCENPL